MASLKDIANEVGVSVSLVSKVLNNRFGTTGARKDLIERIRNTADEIGYQRNHNAVALLAKRQYAFSVFIHRSGAKSAGFTEQLLEGIAIAARRKHLRMILNFFTDADEFREKINELHKGIVDGIIITGVVHRELTPKFLHMLQSGVKIISIYGDTIHPDIPNVGLEDSELTYLGTKHLIEQGCQSIAHFDLVAERTNGYKRALKDAGLPVDDKLIVKMPPPPEGFDPKAGEDAIRQLLKRKAKFDGISAQSDSQAFGAINELFRQGIRIPKDVKVVGVDDSPSCETAIVPLSSVTQNYHERGQIAVELLERAMEKPTIRSVQVSSELKVRESSL